MSTIQTFRGIRVKILYGNLKIKWIIKNQKYEKNCVVTIFLFLKVQGYCFNTYRLEIRLPTCVKHDAHFIGFCDLIIFNKQITVTVR